MVNSSYEDLLKDVLDNGVTKTDRTGVGTRSVFGRQIRFDLSEGFPLITTKKVFFKGVAEELLWFINGDTSSKSLEEKKVNIWREWQDDDGLLGPVYGAQLTSWYSPSETLVEIPVKTTTKFTSSEPEAKNVLGVGFCDDELRDQKQDSDVFQLWIDMLRACFDESHPQYVKYGAQGYTVSEFWLNFKEFNQTIHLVPGFYRWRDNKDLLLDPQYYGSKIFAPDTTVFASSEYIDSTPQDSDDSSVVLRKRLVFNQLEDLVEGIRKDPSSRRHVVSFWNPADIPAMALAPCHMIFQVYVNDGKLSLHIYQRSADLFLGVPFNIASYALLAHMLAQQTGFDVGELVWTGGDVHIYDNHIDAVIEQLSRDPKVFPTLKIVRKPETIFGYRLEDFLVDGYDPHPAIRAEVAV